MIKMCRQLYLKEGKKLNRARCKFDERSTSRRELKNMNIEVLQGAKEIFMQEVPKLSAMLTFRMSKLVRMRMRERAR
jgi:hypothetical protein